MKFLTTITLLFLGLSNSFSQTVGIGTTTPNPKSALEIVQGTQPQGLLIPRMKAVDRVNINPTTTETGMLVYDLDSLDLMQWDGAIWKKIGVGPIDDMDWMNGPSKLTTTKNVGINVASPGQELEVGGDVIFGGGASNFDSGEEFVQIKSESESWYVGVMNGTNPMNNDFFITNDLSATPNLLHIEPNGDIGVGTNTPDVNLDVNGSIAIKDTLVGTTSAVLEIGDKSYYKIESVPGDFVSLTKGLTVGQIIIIQCTGVNVGIVDDALLDAENTGVILEHNDTVTFIWDGAQWIQTAFSDNSPP